MSHALPLLNAGVKTERRTRQKTTSTENEVAVGWGCVGDCGGGRRGGGGGVGEVRRMGNVKDVAPGSRKRGRGGVSVTKKVYIKTFRARRVSNCRRGCQAHDGLVRSCQRHVVPVEGILFSKCNCYLHFFLCNCNIFVLFFIF